MDTVNANFQPPSTGSRHAKTAFAAVVAVGAIASAAHVGAQTPESLFADRLKAAYPGIVRDVTNNIVTFTDGTTLPFDDGKGKKTFAAWLDNPDIADMADQPYPWGSPITPPHEDFDPGRARNTAFFKVIYGDCTTGGVKSKLVTIPWMPKSANKRIRVSSINNVADAFRAVSHDLDALPNDIKKYVTTLGGTYNCRTIAGTGRLSAHAYGIAIDIAPARSDYWRWTSSPGKPLKYRNRIPAQIVAIFERHGFIWGGRWSHYDTMHFEYRPELLPR